MNTCIYCLKRVIGRPDNFAVHVPIGQRRYLSIHQQCLNSDREGCDWLIDNISRENDIVKLKEKIYELKEANEYLEYKLEEIKKDNDANVFYMGVFITSTLSFVLFRIFT